MSAKSALVLLNECKSQPNRSISFGCPTLDQQIGPILSQGITEICGEAGSGKTQLCLVLALQAILQSNMQGSAAFISCGEGSFPIRRLAMLTEQFEQKYENCSSQALLSKVHIEECRNYETALDTVQKRLPAVCSQENLKLLVIDSLAGMIRFEYDTRQEDQMRQRTQMFFSLAAQLKWLADIHHIAILVVNQMTTSTELEAQGALFFASRDNRVMSDDMQSIPALGLAWATCVNTRLLLSKHQVLHSKCVEQSTNNINDREWPVQCEVGSSRPIDASVTEENSSMRVTRRRMQTLWSSCYPANSASFEIRADGISACS